MSKIVPFSERAYHPPEAGRIRIGVKTAKAMKKINTFRFTSPHRALIEQIAEQYGGTPTPWNEPTAAMQNQWEVITTSDTIKVMLPQGGLNQHYELWAGGGVQRRCDGETCEIAGKGPEAEMVDTPCICRAKGEAECKPHTRVNVVLPDVSFMGQWRYETKSEHAVHEMTGMHEMLSALTATNAMVKCHMVLQQRTKMVRGKKQHFNVVVFGMSNTPAELLSGAGAVRPSLSGGEATGRRALTTASETPVEVQRTLMPETSHDVDAEVIDAEVIEDDIDDRELEDRARTVADRHDLDPDAFVTALWASAGTSEKVQSALQRVTDGEFVPTGINEGRVTWTKLVD